MDWDKASIDLGKKLDPKHVKPAKQFGPKGDYIEGWHAMAEANRIFGFGGWSYTVMDCKPVMENPRKIGPQKKDGFGVSYVATVRVTVDCVTREDVGAGHGYDADLGLAHESAIKEAVTDALKRAIRSFGSPFGLALYDKSRDQVGVDAPADDGKDNETRWFERNLPNVKTPDGINALLGRAKNAGPEVQKLLHHRAQDLNLTFDKQAGEYVPAQQVAA